MNCVSVSCSAENLNHILCHVFNPSAEYFKFLGGRLNAAEVILRDVLVAAVSCCEGNAVDLGPGWGEDGVLADVDAS